MNRPSSQSLQYGLMQLVNTAMPLPLLEKFTWYPELENVDSETPFPVNEQPVKMMLELFVS